VNRNPRHACGAQPGDQITARLLGIVVENITTGRVDEDPRCRAKGGSIHPGAFEERAGRQGIADPIASRKCQALDPSRRGSNQALVQTIGQDQGIVFNNRSSGRSRL